MKNLTKFLLVVGVFSIASLGQVSAAVQQCGDPSQSTIDVTYVSCGNGSPELVTSAWGTTNSGTPHVQPGQSVTDESGISSLCPSFFTNYCVDITHTEYYRNQMKAIAQQLQIAQFLSQFPKMNGWIGK